MFPWIDLLHWWDNTECVSNLNIYVACKRSLIQEDIKQIVRDEFNVWTVTSTKSTVRWTKFVKKELLESVSPWSSPVVMENKKDGSHKFCIDFRKVNKVTKVGSFPMPFDADAPDFLANTSVFSTFDLKSDFGEYKCILTQEKKTRLLLIHIMVFMNS